MVLIGPDLAFDLELEIWRSMMRLSSETTYAKYFIRKSLVALSKCLILVMSDKVSMHELKNLAENLMKVKPIGVVYEERNDLRFLANDVGHHTWPFPVIFEKVNGKSHKFSMTFEDESCCFRRQFHPLP